MRPLFMLPLFSLLLLGNDLKTCQSCHPIISQEFQHSLHQRSTPKTDPIHNAVWKKHPDHAKGEYKCAKCHAPQQDQQSIHQGITCLSCHTIIDIKQHPQANENLYETKDKTLYSAQAGKEKSKVVYQEKSSWFGLIKERTGSPYHDIDYRNPNFYTGNVCMGCHSHKRNSKGFELCRTNEEGAHDRKQNCITCHMPKVNGSATTIRESQTHAFHGFAGAHNAPEMLSQYIDLTYQPKEGGFKILINNRAPHDLMLHPLRQLELRVTQKHANRTQSLPPQTFARIIGTQGHPSAPWLADEIIHNNMIHANEKRWIDFNTTLKSGDTLEVTLGYYIITPQQSQKLQLNAPELSSFKPLKHAYFKVP